MTGWRLPGRRGHSARVISASPRVSLLEYGEDGVPGVVVSKSVVPEMRAIGLDHLAAVRHVHCAAVRAAGEQLTGQQTDALLALIHSARYADQFLAASPVGAWIDSVLVATGGWLPPADSGQSARIVNLVVDPMFRRLGIGRTVLEATEARARRGGYPASTVRATVHSAPFFEHRGYAVTSYGAWAPCPGTSLPAVFLRKQFAGASKTARGIPTPPRGRISPRLRETS